MDGQDLFNGLEFHDQKSGDQDIGEQLAIQRLPFIQDRDLGLRNELEAPHFELVTKAFLIHGFEQPWSK